MRDAATPTISKPTAARARLCRLWPAATLGCLLALALLLPTAAQAQAQWKWRDAQGQVNISDRPPPREIPEKDILARPQSLARRATMPASPEAASAAASAASAAPPSEAASAPATALQREVQERARAAEREQAAKAKADAEQRNVQRAENCRRARSHLAALDSGQRIARMNDKGEREVLDDKGRADEQRRAREVIASDCR